MIKGILLALGALGLVVGCQSACVEAPSKVLPIVYSPDASLQLFGLEKLHPFDVKKYDKIYQDLKVGGFAENTHAPAILTKEDLLLVHTEEYLNSLDDKELVAGYLEAPVLMMVPGLNVRKNVVQPFIIGAGGTLKAARLAIEAGAAINLAGGYHHAMPDAGEGFCVIADVPIAIRKLQKEGVIKRALIVDTDIHQGNGTVMCLQNDPTTYTFSIHEGEIYPWPKPAGDRDVVVEVGVTDRQYLDILEVELERVFAESKPDIVFHVAGCDALVGDPLANGQMTHEGIAKRDSMVLRACR